MSMPAKPFTEQFEAICDALPGSSRLRTQRREALERFAETGLPGRRHERWRYSDFSKLEATAFDWSGAAQIDATGERLLAEHIIDLGGPRFVFVDGRFARALSRQESGRVLELHPLTDDFSALPEGFPSQARLGAHPFALLNTAFTRDGLVLRVPDDQATMPIVIAFLGVAAARRAIQPRIVIDLGARASADVVLQLADASDNEAWTNIVVEIRQGAGSKLALARIQEHGTTQTHTSVLAAALARDAALRLDYIDLGGHVVRNDIDIKLEAAGASAELNGTFLALGEQHIDNHILLEHIAAETRSQQAFRGIAGDRGRGVFSGKVVVHADAQRIDARQRSDNLLLAKTAEIDATPALEIYADDVKCSHGATVGELDPQHLFYLQSRGIDAEAARALLTFAFANAALERVESPTLRRWLIDRVASRLPAHERWESLVA